VIRSGVLRRRTRTCLKGTQTPKQLEIRNRSRATGFARRNSQAADNR